jgi:hypothetical protein
MPQTEESTGVNVCPIDRLFYCFLQPTIYHSVEGWRVVRENCGVDIILLLLWADDEAVNVRRRDAI